MDLFEWAADNVTVEEVITEAVARVERNADSEWLLWAERAVVEAAADNRFTTDDVWHLLDAWRVEAPHEPRALGAVMRRMARVGVIRSTGEYVKSERVECHGRPIVVWSAA